MSLLNNILGVSAYWQVNKDLAKKTSVDCALLLSDLISKYSYFENKEMLIEFRGDLYFFATAESIEEDTTFSYKVQKRTIEELKKHGLIKTKLMGVPAKLHFTICEDKILQLLQTSSSKKSILDKPKSQNLYINKNKDNKNKEKTTTTKEKIEVVEVPDFVKKEQEEKRKLAEQYTSGKLYEEETKEALYKDEKTRMSFKRVISQNEILSKVVTTDEAFRECFKHLIDEIVHNASLKEEFPRALVKSREHFSNFSKKLVAEQPERFKKRKRKKFRKKRK